MSFKDIKTSMSIPLLIGIALVLGIITIPHNCPAQEKFPANKVKEDFKYLYETLEASSYDLFMFTDKKTFDREYERIYNSLTDSLSFLEIHKLFQSFAALAKFSHCKISFPNSTYQKFYRNGGHFFPLMFYFVDNAPKVLCDYSENENIAVGDEIIKINGQAIESVLKKMFVYISGENENYKRAFLEMAGSMHMYWYVFGDFDKSTIELKKSDGRILTVQVKGVLLDEYNNFYKNNTDVPSKTDKSRSLKFIEKTAYLHPGIFLNNKSRKVDIGDHSTFDTDEFKTFIDSVFIEISNHHCRDLIIDIRGNNGGDNSFSDYMISYFADKPFRSASQFRFRTSEMTKSFWKDVDIPEYQKLKDQIMNLENGERFDADLDETLPLNNENQFKGKVYVLINRYSYSNSATVASIIQDYGFGTLIGEETSCVLSSCSGIHQFKLPHTNMNVIYPKLYSVRPNGDTSLRGVIPDYLVEDNPFTKTDEVLEFTLNLINSNEK